MEFLGLLGVNVAIIVTMVAVLQFIKKPIRKKLLTAAKKETLDKVWIGVVFFFGLVAALVVELVSGIASFNLWLFIQHAFSYAAGAAFVYMMRKTFLPSVLQDDDEEKKPEVPADPPVSEPPFDPTKTLPLIYPKGADDVGKNKDSN